jgi:hypothetical protein
MQTSGFFRKFGRDLVYLCVIGGLSYWIIGDKSRQEAWNITLAKDIRNTEFLYARQNEEVSYQIKKNLSESPKKDSLNIESRLRLAKNAVDVFLYMNTNKLSQLIIQEQAPDYILKRSLSESEINTLERAMTALNDSLLICVEDDPESRTILQSILAQDETNKAFWTQAKQLKRHETWPFIEDLMLRSRQAYTLVLYYLKSETDPPVPCFSFFPVAFSQKSVLRPGETYHADIYLSQYYKTPKNTQIWVNRKSIPLKEGLAHFAQKYNIPGEKKFQVEIQITNPLTKQMTPFKKEFSLMVVDSCR